MATAPPPQTIGRYQLLSELGKGAMGVVYRAQDPTIGRIVALKTMRVDVHGIEAEEMLGRFRNEARAAGVLNHPNIVTVFDAGEESGSFYMALECIEGETLAELLHKQRVLPLESVIEMARQVCAGLDYAHAHGIIHRDIKPANIMITPDGTAKIMDFGIAKGSGLGGLTTTGQVMGTPNYMSPEQVKGKPLDGRSDLFSFGVILYELLTGEKPFQGDNVTTVIYKLIHEEPQPPHELDVTIPRGLSAVVMKAIAKKAEDRYQRGADLARDLANYKEIASDTPASGHVTAAAVAAAMAEVPAPSFQAAAAAPGPAAETAAGRPTPPLPAAAAAPAHSNRTLLMVLIGIVALAAVLGVIAAARRFRASPVPESSTAGEPAPPPATLPSETGASTDQGDDKVIVRRHEPESSQTASSAPAPVSATPAAASATRDARVTSSPAGRRATLAASPSGAGGMLALKSTPPGAKVFLDGADSGKLTPAQLKVAPGEHAIALRLNGYKDATVTAKLGAGDTYHFAPELEKAPSAGATLASPFKKLFGGGIPEGKGQLEVKSKPKGAAIFVNGQKQDRPTPDKINLDPGRYTIRVQMDGYQPFQTQVEVVKGKGSKFEPTLVKSK